MPRIEILDVRGVTRSFGGRPVLRGVTTRFESGTITFIEGPNGAGKSTLLGVLATALIPSGGVITYEPLESDPQEIRKELGWLSHDSRTYRDLTGRENVELAARLHGVDPGTSFDRASAKLGLGDFADQRVSTLSRGQRQRVALARAIVHAPSVLLLDEPMTGLDPDSAERVLGWMVEESAHGAVVIVVSHVVGLPARMKARVVRVERGRIVRDARPSAQ